MKLFNKLSLIVVAPIKYVGESFAEKSPFLSIFLSVIYTLSIPFTIICLATYFSVFNLFFGIIIWFLLYNHGMNLLIDSAKEIDN